MKITVKDVSVNYIRYGDSKKKSIVFLHGWGQNIEMMKPLSDARIDNNDCIVIDLPGFGVSEEPKFAWQVDDYTECLKEILDKLNVKKPILIIVSNKQKICNECSYSLMFRQPSLLQRCHRFQKEIMHNLSVLPKLLCL